MVRLSLAVSLAVMAALPARAQDAEAGQVVFKQVCGICHDAAEGKNRIGPSLHALVGRTAGQVPNFRYSEANKNSGLVWDTATLDRYLLNPKAVIPGTTMSYAGMKDDHKRADLVAYLQTLK